MLETKGIQQTPAVSGISLWGKFFLFKRPLGWRVLPSGRSSPASLVAGALHFGEIEEKQSEQREFGFFPPNWLS